MEGSIVNTVCRNFNLRRGFRGIEIWTISGNVVGIGSQLMFNATRDLAGVYTCSPDIAPAVYEVVVQCKLLN